jgi:hypothetical protein
MIETIGDWFFVWVCLGGLNGLTLVILLPRDQVLGYSNLRLRVICFVLPLMQALTLKTILQIW